MDLEQSLIDHIENLGNVTWKRMFGLQAALIDGKLMGGYRKVDDSVIYIMLILSPKGYEQAMEKGYFSKFDFGKTWVEGEITSPEDLELLSKTIEDSYTFVKGKPKK